MDLDPARLVLEALEREGVRYAVFGAVALGSHGLARATEALDVFLAPEADNVERLKRALHGVFADPSIDEITSEDLLGEYPAVQYVPPEGAFHLDIVSRLGEAFRWQDLEVLRAPFEGLTVSVLSPRTLFRMKSDTVRAKDRADAEPGDPAPYRALRRVWALHARTLQPRLPPGVHRHRSLAEMNALQERWDEANFLAHRERMSHPPLDAGSEPAAPEIDAAGVDRAQIRAMLELSPEERLRVLEEFLDSVRAIRSFNEAGRIR